MLLDGCRPVEHKQTNIDACELARHIKGACTRSFWRHGLRDAEDVTGGVGPLAERVRAHKFVNLKSTLGLSWLDREPWPVNLLTKSMTMSVLVCAQILTRASTLHVSFA